MIVAIPFCSQDFNLALALVKWIKVLGGVENYDALLIADAAVQWSDCVNLLGLSNSAFRKTDLITTPEPVSGWKEGSTAMFKRACEYAKEKDCSFLWLEPDSAPMKRGWLDDLEYEYKRVGKPFMGHVYGCQTQGLPRQLMSGVGVYPPNALNLLSFGAGTFDVQNANTIVPKAHSTKLVHHIWGTPEASPVFASANVPGTNVFCLSQFPDAVLFHRCKDGSLIRMLKISLGITGEKDFVVAIPFCSKDGEMQRKNVAWMAEMRQPKTHDAILSFDSETPRPLVDTILSFARMSFKTVSVFTYPAPPSKVWPQAPNHAFQHLAIHCYETVKRPWLFLESDEIPVVPDWLLQLQAEYDRCGKPFMGHRVEMLGHMNGGGIYPWNFPEYSPKGMMADGLAWDWVMKDEMIEHCHAANHLIEQCTKVINGVPNIHQGDVPTFRSQRDVDSLLKPGIVLFHRCKDGTLIDRLRERRRNK